MARVETEQTVNRRVWDLRNRDRAERFDRALQDTESPTGGDEFTKERTVVSALRTLGAQAGAGRGERERIRERVVAGSTPQAELPRTASSWRGAAGSRNGSGGRRAGALVATAAAACVVVAALSAQLAQDALPGEMLYEVKRTTEGVSLEATFGQNARAFKHIELASTRVAELDTIATSNGVSDAGHAASPPLYRAILDDLDTDARHASRVVTSTATRASGEDLQTLRVWAAEQVQRLQEIKAAMPGEVTSDVEASMGLLSAIRDRATALSERMDCYQITTGSKDELGAVPADKDCDRGAPTQASQDFSTGDPHPARDTDGPADPGGAEPTG